MQKGVIDTIGCHVFKEKLPMKFDIIEYKNSNMMKLFNHSTLQSLEVTAQ